MTATGNTSGRQFPRHVASSVLVRAAAAALICTGLLTVATMSAINFALRSDFKWLLVVPAVAWLIGLLCYVAGRTDLRSATDG